MTDDDDRRDAPPEPRDDHEHAVLAALERTRADLADHGARTPAMPASLHADLARVLAEESRPAPRPAPPPRLRRTLVLVAAAVVVLVLAVGAAVVGLAGAPAPRDQADGPTTTAPDVPVLRDGDGAAALRAGLGRTDYGPLADPARLADCLAGHGVAPGVRPVGAREVVVETGGGRVPGVALVLPTGVAARFRVLVVDAGCTRGTPLTVSDTVVGR